LRGSVALAFRRLAIIDLAGGQQPILNEEGDVALMCNGEIYNHRELRVELEARGHRFRSDSDVETLVHLYEESGARAAERLRGMFAFAVADFRGPRPRLVLGRDRLGIKPLYWAVADGTLLFGSEPKALLASGLVGRRLDARKLLEFLVQGYVGGEDAAFEGLKRLPPASTLTWSAGERAAPERYWDLPVEGMRGPAAPGEILEELDRAVREHLMSDVPLGVFLSGGIDSTAVATSMARAGVDPLVALSVGFREPSHDELPLARETARLIGARHHEELLEPDPRLALEVLPWFFDEPHADPSDVPSYLVARMARQHVTVALAGDGGDEVFAGYRRYVHDVAENRVRGLLGPTRRLVGAVGRAYPKLDRAPRWLRGKTFLTNVGDDAARAYWRSVTQLERGEALALLCPELARELAASDPFEAFERHWRRPRDVDALYRAQYADFHTYLPDQILAKADRAAMAVSLEGRPPLLDHQFVERFANLPAREKIRRGRGKHALREALRGRVRDAILDGPKRGFDVPLRPWIAGPLSAAVAEAIEALPADWFERGVLRARLAEHRGGGRDHGRLLWSLLVLEHWRRRHAVDGLAL
jgi:asparagine synthase (glutamine-hydrolysing)